MILLRSSSFIYDPILKHYSLTGKNYCQFLGLATLFTLALLQYIHVLPLYGIFIPAPFFIQIIPTKMISSVKLCQTHLSYSQMSLTVTCTSTLPLTCPPVFCISTQTLSVVRAETRFVLYIILFPVPLYKIRSS